VIPEPLAAGLAILVLVTPAPSPLSKITVATVVDLMKNQQVVEVAEVDLAVEGVEVDSAVEGVEVGHLSIER
jgi:hypothetical protein